MRKKPVQQRARVLVDSLIDAARRSSAGRWPVGEHPVSFGVDVGVVGRQRPGLAERHARGQLDAAAKAKDKGDAIGGEITVDNITIYQLTESGLALQATIKGTKFWRDDALN